MASSSAAFAILLFFFAVAVQSARGGHQLACEELPPDACAFAVSSGGRRCVLERTPEGAHRCQTSAVVGMQMQGGWVETRDRRVRVSLPALCEAEKKAGNRRMMTGKAPLGAPVAAPEAAPAPCEE
ncbi:PAR1 protein [Zea mays]|uniref:PAR1 protein n=1 Tax=Zea mays TaxID=4577 RepID=K7VF48_MAIZE|nr:PAR1 protein [Zea mays]